MKKLITLVLSAAVLFTLAACTEEEPKIEQPVQLYYRTAVADNEIASTVIAPLTAEGAELLSNPQALLNEYLKGTSAEGFLATFPAGTKLLSMEITDGTAYLLLNTSITSLSGADLTIACACITMTTIELTGVNTVRIRSISGTLEGAEEIVMDKQCLILQDLYTPEPTN